MDNFQEHIQALIADACRHRIGSAQRQKRLTQIIRLVSDKLWNENVSYYQDALQQTWIYFCQNLCEAKTGKVYDPQKASLITWLNAYLKRRLQDKYIAKTTENKQKAKPLFNLMGDNPPTDPIDLLEAKPDIPPMLQDVKQWAETDPRLQQIHILGHPNITARLLILRRLPPEAPWKVLAADLNVSIGTLASFYQRQCMPLLREFGQNQGYL